MLAVAIPLVTGGRIEAVYLALIPMVAIAAFEGVQPLTTSVQQLDSSRAAGDRLFELVDAPPPVVDPAEPVPASAIAMPPAIRIDHLTFAYDAGGRPALSDVSLDVPAGGSLAIVGASGSGKTTIVNLLLRFWDYEAGEIRIGGVELRDLRADDVRRQIAVVSQRVDLFDATIRDNLALADPDVTDAQLDEACRIAQLADVIAGAAGGVRHPDRRERRAPERRRAAAARDRAGDPPRRAGPRSSTRRPRTSTRPRSGRSSRPCGRSSPAARRWSSPTARRWPSSRSGRSGSRRGASSAEAPTRRRPDATRR